MLYYDLKEVRGPMRVWNLLCQEYGEKLRSKFTPEYIAANMLRSMEAARE